MAIVSFGPEVAPPSSYPARKPPAFTSHSSCLEAANDPKDVHFLKLLRAYRGHGGLSRARHLASALDYVHGRATTFLDQWLADGTLFSLDWQSEIWMPTFQFTAERKAPCPRARSVISELTPTFVGWELADWFVEPNNWLDGNSPIELLDADTEAVRQAARADRFIAAG